MRWLLALLSIRFQWGHQWIHTNGMLLRWNTKDEEMLSKVNNSAVPQMHIGVSYCQHHCDCETFRNYTMQIWIFQFFPSKEHFPIWKNLTKVSKSWSTFYAVVDINWCFSQHKKVRYCQIDNQNIGRRSQNSTTDINNNSQVSTDCVAWRGEQNIWLNFTQRKSAEYTQNQAKYLRNKEGKFIEP